MLLLPSSPCSTRNYSNPEVHLHVQTAAISFSGPSGPEPPASALSVPRPGELSVSNAVSIHALSRRRRVRARPASLLERRPRLCSRATTRHAADSHHGLCPPSPRAAQSRAPAGARAPPESSLRNASALTAVATSTMFRVVSCSRPDGRRQVHADPLIPAARNSSWKPGGSQLHSDHPRLRSSPAAPTPSLCTTCRPRSALCAHAIPT